MTRAKTKTAFWIGSFLLLAGCSNGNWGPSSIQFNRDAVDYPENFRGQVIEVMARQGINTAGTVISSPAPAVGAGPWTEQRWYVCVLGVASEPQDKGWKTADMALALVIDPSSQPGVHNLVFFFSDVERAPTVRSGFDSPLCKNIQYQSLPS